MEMLPKQRISECGKKSCTSAQEDLISQCSGG
uniref:Uncharacterized protein n=1 Tax=Anopheles minimus TaxID=112268 RepID=A0A182WQ78_9DIPT